MNGDHIDELLRQARADVIAEFTAAVDRRFAMLGQRLRATRAEAATGPDRQRLKLISLGEAAQRARLSKVRMRAVCSNHLHGSPGGFAYKRGPRWEVVDDDPFQDWLRRRASA